MQLPNGNVLVGVKHFDLAQIDKEFIGCTINSLADPKSPAGKEVIEDFRGCTFTYVMTEYMEEIGNEPHLALRMGVGIDYLFQELNIPGIHFLGCYWKNADIQETYADWLDHLVIVLEFDR